MDTVKNVVRNADIWKKQKYYFLNRIKYIEGSLMKSFGKISKENKPIDISLKSFCFQM